MAKSDIALAHPMDFLAAVGLLTRLPVQIDGAWAQSRGARAAWAYPLVGLLLGAGAAVLAIALTALGLTGNLTAGVIIALGIFVTGALHEDGLADTADGLWGGWTRESRLEIMKDSRIGAYGVLALVLGLVIKWQAVSEVLHYEAYWALPALAAGSRMAMVALMWALPHARTGGLSQSVGPVPGATCALGIAIAAVLFIPLGGTGFWVALGLGPATWGCGKLAIRKIGGQTGDILGATQFVTEAAGLILVTMLL